VALTANAFADDRRRCLGAGMDDFLTEPLVAELLFETMLRWLPRARGGGERVN
jgi:CheY-like chemotaxis protein